MSQPDFQSKDGLVKALYRSISFPPGGRPDWETLRKMMLPDAHLTRVGSPNPDGNDCLTVDEFLDLSQDFLLRSDMRARGFVEKEVMRHTETFGRIAHIFSTYESRYFGQEKLLVRGTNSMQLLWKEGRWWLVNLLWDEEEPGQSHLVEESAPEKVEINTVNLDEA